MRGKLLTLVLGCWAVLYPVTQGDTNNVLLNNWYDPSATHPIYYLVVGNPAQGPGFYVEILGGPVSGPLTPVPSEINGQWTTTFPISEGGLFEGGIGIVPGVPPDGYADFIVRAWYGAATFESAPERVQSSLLSNVKVGDSSSPTDLPNPSQFPFPAGLVIVPIPEPTATALGVWACVLLVGLRRRRRPPQ